MSYRTHSIRVPSIYNSVARFELYFLRHYAIFMALLILLSTSFAGFYALRLGQDINADQRNYHFESAHEFMDDRLAIDAAPAGLIHSYFNPLPYVPFYLMAMHLPARVIVFCLGAWDGLVIPLLFLIGFTVTCGEPLGRRLVIAALATVISAAAPMALSELGTTFADLELSPILLLGVLCLLTANSGNEPGRPRLFTFLGAALIGAAVGLKLTNSIYVVGVAACCWFGREFWRGRIETTALAGLGGALGIAISSGFWFLKLWRLFHSPVFPYYDNIFVSPEIDKASKLHGRAFVDRLYLPHSLWDAVKFPFDWLFVAHRTSEIDFRDIRFAILSAALLLAASVALCRYARYRNQAKEPRKQGHRALSAAGGKLLIFFVASFCAWVWLFSIQRYLIGLELLVGPMLLVALNSFLRGSQLIAGLAAITIASWSTVVTCDWAHTRPRGAWYEIQLPDVLLRPAMVFINNATSFVAPFLPPQTIVANVTFRTLRAGSGAFDDRIVARALAESPRRPAYIITDWPVEMAPRGVLARYGLQLTGPCWRIENKVEFLAACQLERVAPSGNGVPFVHPGQTIEFGLSMDALPYVTHGLRLASGRGWISGADGASVALRADTAFGDRALRVTFSLNDFGELRPNDTLIVSANGQVVSRWRLGDAGMAPVALSACIPASDFDGDRTTLLSFAYQRPAADGVISPFAPTIGLDRIRVDAAQDCAKTTP